MSGFRKPVFCLVFLITSIATIYPQTGVSVTANGNVIAEVISVYSATETSRMNFGRFAPGPQGGEIILTPESTLSIIGNIHTAAGLHNAASFYISGDPDASFTISLPSEAVVLKHVSSSKTMLINNWMSTPGPGLGAGILNNGEQTVFIGATLKVGSPEDNPVGVYAGTYTVTFDFN